MLETLVSLANGVEATFYYLMYGSYKTGSVIVSTANTILEHLTNVVASILYFFVIVYDSLTVFLQDNVQFLSQIARCLALGLDSLYALLCITVSKMGAATHLITSLANAIFVCIKTVFVNIKEAVVLLKRLLILFGSGVWFLIASIPMMPYYIVQLFCTIVIGAIQEVIRIGVTLIVGFLSLIKNVILFAVDVPVEAVVGILIATSIIYVAVQFYLTIYNYLRRNVVRPLRNRYHRLWSRIRSSVVQTETRIPATRNRLSVRTPRITTRQHSTLNESKKNVETTCVICQERLKCILLLPCKHLCLCEECIHELRYYEQICPICRTQINNTLRVYV